MQEGFLEYLHFKFLKEKAILVKRLLLFQVLLFRNSGEKPNHFVLDHTWRDSDR
jgi:hypothetical protein